MIEFQNVRRCLRDNERLLQTGAAAQALEALKLLFAQLQSSEPQGMLASAAVLSLMSRAAAALDDEANALLFLQRAVELLQRSCAQTANEAEVLLGLAETLRVRGCRREALHFAVAALERAAEEPGDFSRTELAEILRRYARIARWSGVGQSAYSALTLALVLIYDCDGTEIDAGLELANAAAVDSSDASGLAIARIAQHLLLDFDFCAQAASISGTIRLN